MKESESNIRLLRTENGDWEVWIAELMCLGSGVTCLEAMRSASVALKDWLEEVGE
jgi:hypothetical protein